MEQVCIYKFSENHEAFRIKYFCWWILATMCYVFIFLKQSKCNGHNQIYLILFCIQTSLSGYSYTIERLKLVSGLNITSAMRFNQFLFVYPTIIVLKQIRHLFANPVFSRSERVVLMGESIGVLATSSQNQTFQKIIITKL